MNARRYAALAVLALSSLGLAACMDAAAARSAAPPASPPPAPAPALAGPSMPPASSSKESRDAAGGLAALSRAEAEIAEALSKGSARRGARETAGGAQPQTEAHQPGGNPCETACRALASMTRSAEHVCEMAGDGDARCHDARARVKGAGERVRGT